MRYYSVQLRSKYRISNAGLATCTPVTGPSASIRLLLPLSLSLSVAFALYLRVGAMQSAYVINIRIGHHYSII